MKKAELNNVKLTELSQDEMMMIEGGGHSLWYYVGEGIGAIAAGVEAFMDGAGEGGYAANKA